MTRKDAGESAQRTVRKIVTEITENRAARKAAAAQIAELDDRLGELVRAAFLAGLTGSEIARAAGVSKERTYQIRDGR